MRARRISATKWERINSRDWIYAGVGKGADIAAWNQAARAEMAAMGRWKTGYAQALLDLVKAFERAPCWLLVQEAVAMGYPLWLLSLSIATYRLPRTWLERCKARPASSGVRNCTNPNPEGCALLLKAIWTATTCNG